MSGERIGVVAALAEEIRPLARRLRARRAERRAGRRFVCGRLGGAELVLAVSGDGAAAAEGGVEALLEAFRPRALLALGAAGGLSPDLEVLDLLAAREVLDPSGLSQRADPDWLQRAVAGGRAVEGALLSVERVAVTAAGKRQLWERHDRRRRLAVDLESAAYARTAARRRVPWLVVRGISDVAAEDLPLDFDRLAGTDGRVSRGRVLAHLALRLHRLPAVLTLRRRVVALSGRLADLAEELVA